MKSVSRNVNLLDSDAVKGYLAAARFSPSRKEGLADHLARFYRYRNIPFQKPHYRREDKVPFIPLESEIDQLIAGSTSKVAAFLQLLKETGMRPGEAWNLRWTDIDIERNSVNVTPEKGSRARQLKISSRLAAMTNQHPHRWQLIFRNPERDAIRSLDNFRRRFERRRARVAQKLGNPRIRAISFKTLRHFRATMEYHRTKDILHVMRLLGHKDIKNTLVYTHLADFEGDEFVCKVAKNVDEAKAIVESGFDYVTDIDGMKLFRKRR